MKTLVLFFAFVVCTTAFAQIPARPQSEAILLTGGTVHVGNGAVIENGAVLFDGGKIVFVGKADSAEKIGIKAAKRISTSGKHIYPGFIAANTTLGLVEIDAARPTRDADEVGAINTNVRTLIAFNTDSHVTPTIRTNGILIAQTTPQGGLISGQSAVMHLDGWNWEDAVLKADDGIHLNFPSLITYSGRWAQPADEQVKQREQSLRSLEQLFKEAKAYLAVEAREVNLRLEAMRGLFDGSKKLFIHVDEAKGIIAAVNFAKSFGITPVIVGGTDAWMVTDILKANTVPVILTTVHKLPARDFDDVNQQYKTPALLKKAGVEFCISAGGAWQQRNLMFEAGTAAAWGLSKEEAISAISRDVAKILGIDANVGTLEKGKDATLLVSAGDALDMKSNAVELAFIRGKNIDLDNQQKALYRKFKGKYDEAKK